MTECYLYIILCNNGAYYTGVTNDFLRRWKEHYKGYGAKYIARNGFNKPLFLQKFPSKSEAMKEEYFVKKMGRDYKTQLIKSDFNILKKDPEFPMIQWKLLGFKGEMPWVNIINNLK